MIVFMLLQTIASAVGTVVSTFTDALSRFSSFSSGSAAANIDDPAAPMEQIDVVIEGHPVVPANDGPLVEFNARATPPREPEVIVFGPPTIFHRYTVREANIYGFADGRRLPFRPELDEVLANPFLISQTTLLDANADLAGLFDRMIHYEALGPREPVPDAPTHFCSCGLCPNGDATTRMCAYLSIYRSNQRFRRRATKSPINNAINRLRNPCFVTPALGRLRGSDK